MFSPGAVTVSVSVPGEELPSCSTHLYASKKGNALFTLMDLDLADQGMRWGQ